MRRKSRKNVGLIGLGIIGSRAAASLRAARYQVYVWNRTPKPVPNFLGNPAEVAEVCEIIQLFVADARALMEVIEAMRGQLTKDHVIVCNATVGPEATLEAAKLVQSCGARFLDAPFTGSKVAAERQQLVYYIGGDEATYLRVKPVLEATSKAIVRVGGIGDAATIKVVTNLISAASVQVLSEALALVSRAGLPPEALAAALEHNAARSGVMDLKLPKMVAGDYEPHFSLKHMLKDVQLGLQLANSLKVETPVTSATQGRMTEAMADGWADEDFSVVYRTYEGPARAHAAPQALPAAPVPVEAPSAPAAPVEAASAPRIFPEMPVPLVTIPPVAAASEEPAEQSKANRPPHIFARIFAEEEEPPATPPAGEEAPPAAEEKPSEEKTEPESQG